MNSKDQLAPLELQIRAAQTIPKSPSQVLPAVARESKSYVGPTKPHSIGINTRASTEPLLHPRVIGITDAPAAEGSAVNEEPGLRQRKYFTGYQENIFASKPSAATESKYAVPVFPSVDPENTDHAARNLQSSKVPSSRIGRLFHYGGMPEVTELPRKSSAGQRLVRTTANKMTEANIKRLVSKLSQMRGAALKLGQFMSIQDTHILPPEVDKIFGRVQDSAHYMPDWQMEQVLASALGPSWSDNFSSFDRIPFAAASIGQVHNAVLRASVSPTGQEERVAIKIQFTNIANSITSDLGYVKLFLTAGRLLPKGLFLDRTVQLMSVIIRGRHIFYDDINSPGLLGQDPRFKIPWVWDGSTDRVLVMEHVDGVSVGELSISAFLQEERDEVSGPVIAKRIIELCLRELFQFRLMQTDPNWTNFLWSSATEQVSLVDFGATREYTKEFMDNWLHLLQAAAREDRKACTDWSLRLGYLTGEENEIMLNAHVDSMILLATPFRPSPPRPFAFGPGSPWSDITGQIRAHIPVMLQHRLTPPLEKRTVSRGKMVTTSLDLDRVDNVSRKLSGAFFLASRLGAVVDAKRLWDDVVDGYQFSGSG
ncbi:ABC1 family-domain-containing protein [Boletus edulis]|nr:ABC1 family-domain-containing protein [Boletus edulis]